MAGRRKRKGKGRWITPSVAEELAREGKLHGPHYQKAFRAASEMFRDINRARRKAGRAPIFPSAYDIHLAEANLAAAEAGRRYRARSPEIWREIDEISALAHKHGQRSTPAFLRELEELKRIHESRRRRR